MADAMVVDVGDYDCATARIIRLCAALQSYHGLRAQWPLSCRVASEYAHISHVRAAKILKAITFERVIELVKKAGPKGSGIASEYRYLGVHCSSDERDGG